MYGSAWVTLGTCGTWLRRVALPLPRDVSTFGSRVHGLMFCRTCWPTPLEVVVQGGLFSAVGGSAESWAVLRHLRPCFCLWWHGLPAVSGSLGALLFGSKGSIWGPLPSSAAMCTQLSSRCGLGSSVLCGSSRCLGLLGLSLSDGAVITKIVSLRIHPSIHPGATFLHVYSYRCSTWRPIMLFHLCSVLLSFSFHLFPLPFFLALFLVLVNSGNAVLDMHSCE